MNHAQFREWLENKIKDLGDLLNENLTSREALHYTALKKGYENSLCQFNKLPDVAAELEKWIDSQNKFDNEYTTHISIFQLKEKLKELSK
jgi:hypothetical protein